MNKLSHEILLALSYVSQISDPASVKSRFFESLNGLGADFSFSYVDQLRSGTPEHRVLPIATLRSSFGYAVMAESPESGEADLGVFRSAFKFLAVILENRIQAQELELKNISLLREISHEKSLLRTVFDTLPVGVWVVDKDGTILVGNAAGGKIWGGTSCIGTDRYSDYKAYGPDTGKRIESGESAVARAIKQGETLVGQEITIECFDGIHKTILNSAAPLLDDEQGVIGAVCVNQDITERKQSEEGKLKLEAQLQQAQKMEAVGQLAGGVAHDFNNMLGVIMGHAEMAMTQMNPAHPVFTDLEGIRRAAGRSADITRQLLAFARKQTVVPKVLDLNEIVEGMLKMLRRLIGEGIDLAWLPGASLWPVKVDPSQFDQILVNLCVNARDALPGVGKLTVETENRTLEEEACAIHTGLVSGEYVRIAVSDNGCGMDKETLSHIFEPFFTTKGIGKGTGLGLSTVYGLQ
jgi:PAS domain S-box-containing protein